MQTISKIIFDFNTIFSLELHNSCFKFLKNAQQTLV